MTLAPEVPGAIALIEHLVRSGVRVAIGHTAATAEAIANGIAAGATLATHLGNGCPQMLPRHPNPIWELLAADDVFMSVIVDGHHCRVDREGDGARERGRSHHSRDGRDRGGGMSARVSMRSAASTVS